MGDGMLAVFDGPVAARRRPRSTRSGRSATPRGATPARSGSGWRSTRAPPRSREGDFFGQALNRDARILAIGHGGQVLAVGGGRRPSPRDRLPDGVELLDLGSHRLRDLDRPEQVFQVAVADLPRDFPPLRSLSTRRSNLPVPLTSFVGRERELGEVERLARAATGS